MSRLKDFWNLIKVLILSIFAIPFFLIIGLIGVVYSVIKHLFKMDYSSSKQLKPIIMAFILASDGIANAGAGELLNDVIKPTKIKYGKWYHTISAVTGIIYKTQKDTFLRKFLDFFEKNHSTKSITPEQEKFYLK